MANYAISDTMWSKAGRAGSLEPALRFREPQEGGEESQAIDITPKGSHTLNFSGSSDLDPDSVADADREAM